MQSSQRLTFEGAQLNVIDEGNPQAKPVLLWHGAACNLNMWSHVIAQLDQQFRFIRFDIRGVGRSLPASGTDQYSFYQYAKDANYILDRLNITRCHIWSMAWGSRAALAFCSLYPDRVLSAAFFDASIDTADVEAQKRGHLQALKQQDATGIERFERPDDWNLHHDKKTMQQAMTAAAAFDLSTAASTLELPTLVATGDCDPNLVSSRKLANLIDGATLEVMKNVGHGSVLQRPDLAARLFCVFQSSLNSYP